MLQYITHLEELQDGKNQWRAKKVANTYLAEAYRSFDSAKAARLADCSTTLIFREYPDGTKKLQSMNSCHVRLCPLCTWRRSLKTYSNTRRIIDYIEKKKHYGYILLTLTCKNVKASELSKTIDKLFYSFKLFSKSALFKSVVKGFYRGLEVTHNTDFLSKDYDTFHPHFHVLLVVNKSYFTDKTYVRHEAWTDLWRRALGVAYTPVVDVRRVKDVQGSKAIAEISKYAAKDSDYIIYDDWDLTVSTVEVLDRALYGRRLCAYGGLMRDAKRALHIEDIDKDSDLVNVGEDLQVPDSDFVLSYYFWHTGYRQYVKGEI